MDVAIKCTTPGCTCDCFSPGKANLRLCSSCQHGWVPHALDKLGLRHLYNTHQVELVQSSSAFDVASLILYGTHAIPVRLKILLDRLLSVLPHEDVLHVLHGFGWTYEDYVRGYILQDSGGSVLERWVLATREEEPLILQQFLRFGETRQLAQHFLLSDCNDQRPEPVQQQQPRPESDIRKFIERSNRVASSTVFKQSALFGMGCGVTVSRPPPTLLRQPSSVSSGHSISPSGGSPAASPLAASPLNKLQNMQPYDFRQEKISPESKAAEAPVINSVTTIQHTTPLSSPNSGHNSVAFMNHSSDFSGSDGCSDEDTNGAINLSQGAATLDSVFAARKVKHLRKSANPMKRRWNPLVLSTLTTNPATGKRRVQCHVCLKTFCDKGALKIHFSAVHLREMHKCTVEGCNMMFSSRRSRNRHSANPNPKLHTPNLRRKISPHDGRTANPFPLLPPTTLINFNNNNLIPPALGALTDGKLPLPLRVTPPPVTSTGTGLPPQLDPEGALPLTKKLKFDNRHEPEREDDQEEGMNLSMKEEEQNASKGVRKRKALNPTKCAAITSDDDLQYVSTDDSSSDTYIDENGILESKSDDNSSDGQEDDSKDFDLDNDDFDDKDTDMTSSSPIPPPRLKAENEDTRWKFELEKSRGGKENADNVAEKVNNSAEREVFQETLQSKKDHPHHHLPLDLPRIKTEDVAENPLRHLESLSLGAFTGLVPTPRSLAHPHSGGVSYHAPGLGLADGPKEASLAHHSNNNNQESNSCGPPMVTSGRESPDQQMSLLPVYRDAALVGTVEIPVDKENPRRCTACGKVFQNHFGVKTHYQNVHLKLMHKCTVEGCNAAFPSKRSRDRHSANLNLHRKLLSTTSDKSPFLDKAAALFPYHPTDLFSRLYDPQGLPLNLADVYHRIPACGTGPEGFVMPPAFPVPPFHPALMPTTTSSSSGPTLTDGGGSRGSPASAASSGTPSPRSSSTHEHGNRHDLDVDEHEDGKVSRTPSQQTAEQPAGLAT